MNGAATMLNLDVRALKYEIDDELLEHIERRLRFALRRFADHVGEVQIQLADVNGPRGGVDKRCRITVPLLPRGVVRVEGDGDDPFALVAQVAKRVGRSVRRTLARRRGVRIGL